MNKTLLTTALIAGLSVAAVANAATPVSSGTITINGTVVASTCSVSINGGTASPTIQLSPVVNTMLTAVGSATGWQPVSIALSGCTAMSGFTTVFPYFTGTNIDTSSGYLKNTGSATGVEIALSNGQSTTNALTLQNGSNAQNAGTQLLSATTPTFSYYAGYVATAIPVGAGGVTTTVQYNLNYQ
ncbi:MAG: fimbrial protein [Rhodanobacter sp.]